MKTFLTWLMLVLFAMLIFLGAKIIQNHYNMVEQLAPLETQFDMVVMDHIERRTPYAGRVDKIISERNAMLREAHYLWVGTWSTGDDGTNAVYLKATWLPDEIYRYAWRVANSGAKNFSDVIAMALIFILPLLAYLGAWVEAIRLIRVVRHMR